jgi:osmotically-inducible protein OsmY
MRGIKLMLLALCVAVGLMACVPAALVVGATAGGSVIYDKRSFKQMNRDHRAQQKIAHKISRDIDLKKNRIQVTVFDNIVLLVGQVTDPSIKLAVAEIAKSVASADQVYNQVAVSGIEGGLQRANDTWIAGKVRSQMLLKSGLNSVDFKVVSDNAVVYLMGSVSRKQASLATDVARRVSGVRKVVKVFSYD